MNGKVVMQLESLFEKLMHPTRCLFNTNKYRKWQFI